LLAVFFFDENDYIILHYSEFDEDCFLIRGCWKTPWHFINQYFGALHLKNYCWFWFYKDFATLWLKKWCRAPKSL